MPRIPPDDTVQISFEEVTSVSTMATLFRVMAHRPEIMHHAIQLLQTTMRSGSVEPQLKELLAVRVSQVNHCSY
ncbi:MAG: carboxymuconolactone decarboxylase family protein [Ktedonobacteraceae bacterium]|nr:carboxymuconolactone decarboxylase family protein [Ktedonobacteraceae bacterium]